MVLCTAAVGRRFFKLLLNQARGDNLATDFITLPLNIFQGLNSKFPTFQNLRKTSSLSDTKQRFSKIIFSVS